MKMRMRSGLVLAAVCLFLSTFTGSSPVSDRPTDGPAAWTTGSPGVNLNQKMFTVSLYRGGISLFSPYLHPGPDGTTHKPPKRQTPILNTKAPGTNTPTTTTFTTTAPTTTTSFTTTTSTYPPWTTAPPTRGVSVCFRFIADLLDTRSPSLFTLSPSSAPLKLSINPTGSYALSYYGYYVNLQPRLRFWTDLRPDIWTSVCVSVDSGKNVAQMFSGSSMSIRKLLPYRYVWSGEPVIDFAGFDGQLTDVQVWDYPLRYKEVLYYMSRGYYGAYQGSVLTWSHISYSVRGDVLLEDVYERQMKQKDRLLTDGMEKMKRKQVM